jgi:molybdopterin molybdotransferase
MITTKEALEILLNTVTAKSIAQDVCISESLDRVCFEDVYSDIDIPTFTRSAMDGYAVRFGNDMHRFSITEDSSDLKENEAMRINTGFPIPDFADSVVEIEKTKKDGSFIYIDMELQKERNFTKKATELAKGDVLLKKGQKISSKASGLLAYAGVVSLKVYQKPIVGIITTGDEVVFPARNLPKNSVFNSNFFILDALVKKWHSDSVYFGHIPDDKAIFKKRLLYALNRCDIILTTGGVSKGTKDYAKDVLKDIGANILFDKSAIKPGKPAAFATYGDKYIFALPGWPAALYTVAYVYLKPFLKKYAGLSNCENRFFEGVLEENMHSQAGKDYFNRVNVDYRDGVFYLKKAGSQKTDNYYSISKADGLAWLDVNQADKSKNEKVPFLFLDD